MKATFSFPFLVCSPHIYSGRTVTANFPDTVTHLVKQRAEFPTTVPDNRVAQITGSYGYLVAIGIQTATFDDLKPYRYDPHVGNYTWLEQFESANQEFIGQETYSTEAGKDNAATRALSGAQSSFKNNWYTPTLPSKVQMRASIIECDVPEDVQQQMVSMGLTPISKYPVPAGMIINAVRGKLGNLCQQMTESIEVKDPELSEPKPNTFVYGAIYKIKASMAASMGGDVKVTVDLQTGQMDVALVIDGVEETKAWQADVDRVNSDLVKQAIEVKNGDRLPEEVVRPSRPSSTIGGPDGSALDKWWADVSLAYDELESVSVTESLDRQTALGSGKTPSDYLGSLNTQVPTAGSDSWKDMLSSVGSAIGSGASKVWDTITNWGPTEILMGYAGYEAVQSAKDSTIPPWLIIGGVGLVALAVLK